MLRNLILHITYLMSRLHSSINKRIASLFEMISAIRGARQQQPLSMNAGSTLLQRRTVEMLVRRCTEPDMNGSSKASQFWDADAPFASASLVEMQKSPGLEGPLLIIPPWIGITLFPRDIFIYYVLPLLKICDFFLSKE